MSSRIPTPQRVAQKVVVRTGEGDSNEKVLGRSTNTTAFFLDSAFDEVAYETRLPILENNHISPYTVASRRSIEEPYSKVLEMGTELLPFLCAGELACSCTHWGKKIYLNSIKL